eukprot:3419361-Rhodomonas_salina.1
MHLNTETRLRYKKDLILSLLLPSSPSLALSPSSAPSHFSLLHLRLIHSSVLLVLFRVVFDLRSGLAGAETQCTAAETAQLESFTTCFNPLPGPGSLDLSGMSTMSTTNSPATSMSGIGGSLGSGFGNAICNSLAACLPACACDLPPLLAGLQEEFDDLAANDPQLSFIAECDVEALLCSKPPSSSSFSSSSSAMPVAATPPPQGKTAPGRPSTSSMTKHPLRHDSCDANGNSASVPELLLSRV